MAASLGNGVISACRAVAASDFDYDKDEIALILKTHEQSSRINTSKRSDNCIAVCIAACVGYQGVPADRLQQQADAYVLGGGCTFPRQWLFFCNRLQLLGINLEVVNLEDILNRKVQFTGVYSIFCILERGYRTTCGDDRKKDRVRQHAVLYGGHSGSGPIYKDFQFSKRNSGGQEPLDITQYLKSWTLISATRVDWSRYDERTVPLRGAQKLEEMRYLSHWDRADQNNPHREPTDSIIAHFQLTGQLRAARKC